MRRYENIFITHADLPDEEIQTLLDRYKAIVEGRKGLVVKIERWGKRKLAYEIKKVTKGFYVLIDFVGQADVVDELERNLKIDDKILKFMTVKTNDDVDMQAIEKEMTAPSKDEKPEPQPIKIISEIVAAEDVPEVAPAK
ncbi:MAG: 30S ribosomal protein S6 [Syntrophales bacterium]|nr:30S ribosomal protein S6 [Syntrophales bacterium]